MEDIKTPFELLVMVNFQGDKHMGKNGAKYLVMPHFKKMDPTRRIFHTKVDSKLPLGKPGVDAGPGKQSQSEEPFVPPILCTKPKVCSKPIDIAVYHMTVTRVMWITRMLCFIKQSGFGL